MQRLAPFLIALLMICRIGSAVDSPDQKSDLADNAALQYWHAFAQLPTLDKDTEPLAAQWSTVRLDDPAAAKLIANSRATVMFLNRAAKLQRCDWGLDYNDGIGLLMPQLSRSRDAARLTALHAREAFERGDAKTGWVDTLTIMHLGRHISSDPVMISLLVGTNLESLAIDAVAPYLLEAHLSAAEAAAELAKLPKSPPFTATLAAEKRYMAEWIIRKLREEESRQPGAWKDFWKALFTGTQEEQSPPQPESAATAIRWVEELLPLYDDLARFMSMPQQQFDAEYPAFKGKTKADHKLARLLLPAIDTVREKESRTKIRHAMLLTAIAIAESGPDKVQQSKDPITGKPFDYRKLDKGFELKSQFTVEGQPVTLTIGQKK
jgi:hypothetical protein